MRTKMNFRDLMGEVNWSWQPQGQAWHQIHRYEDGSFGIDKLSIYPDGTVEYKGHHYQLDDGVYEKFVKFVDFMDQNLEPVGVTSETETCDV